jgi:MFS family permease
VREWLRQAAGGLPRTFWLLWTGSLNQSAGLMLQSPSNSALVADLSPAALRGRYEGVNSLSWSIGAAMAPIGGGFVQEHLGDATLWLGCFGVCALVAAGQWLSGPSRDRRIARLRTAEAILTPDEVAEPELSPARD